MSRLQMNGRGHGPFTVAAPIVNKQFVVQIKPEGVIRATSESIITVRGGHQFARPARGEIHPGNAGTRWISVPTKIHLWINALQDGSALQVGISKEFGI